jgi:hypothetical protein
VFSRRVDAVVVALSWKRTVVIEQERWESRNTDWKPYGDNVRNLRTVQDAVAAEVFLWNHGGAADPGPSKSHVVTTKHTHFEYEELGWHKYRSFSARGDSPADVRWPEYTLEPDQRISERRETYHAKFSADADGSGDEYLAELDEATWRTLEVGQRCRLKVDASKHKVKQVSP